MSGWVRVVGLGPGAEELVTPQAALALEEASDLIGYIPYIRRVPDRAGLTKHASDNRVECARAAHALELAASGRRVAVVSSGDPGVFAMAAALFEALEAGPPEWLDLDIRILPGITAMLAAAARIGAPLGHDFCAINLSDNLKPWEVIATRLQLAAQAGFAMGLYNPRSKARPHQFGQALDILRQTLPPSVPVSFARNVSCADERIMTVSLGEARAEMADMRTVVIIGTAETRQIGRFTYTPRSHAGFRDRA